MAIKAIIFDCFGVLTTDTWRAFIASLPAGIDVEAARKVHRAYDAGLITKAESATQIQEITGSVFTELEDALEATTAKEVRVLETIRELKPRYKIGLLSNVGNSWITDYLLAPEEQALFDTMVFSYQVGMVKPDPRMFELACERLGVRPDEAIMIDDVDRYCDAARRLGMQAIEYKDFGQFKQELDRLIQ